MERTETSEWGRTPTGQKAEGNAGVRHYVLGTRPMAYIAGRYRDSRGEYWVGENIRLAREVMLALVSRGYAPFCPHTQSAFCGGALDDDYIWLDVDREILSRCDVAVFLPGWQSSEGSRCEYECAKQLGKPIYFWPDKPNSPHLSTNG